MQRCTYHRGGLARDVTHIYSPGESTDAAAPAPNASWPLVMVNQTVGCLYALVRAIMSDYS